MEKTKMALSLRLWKKISILGSSLRYGFTQSCGCLNKEIITIHGQWNTKTYKAWQQMQQRCENSKCKFYKNYGGRGITVCARWHLFENFYKDMGDCPKELTFERKNNEKGYSPENCKWATRKEQANNTRPSSLQRWFRTWHKDSMAQYISNNQAEFARKWGITLSHINRCLNKKTKARNKGWEFEYIT